MADVFSIASASGMQAQPKIGDHHNYVTSFIASISVNVVIQLPVASASAWDNNSHSRSCAVLAPGAVGSLPSPSSCVEATNLILLTDDLLLIAMISSIRPHTHLKQTLAGDVGSRSGLLRRHLWRPVYRSGSQPRAEAVLGIPARGIEPFAIRQLHGNRRPGSWRLTCVRYMLAC
jgi:hypothetical protein